MAAKLIAPSSALGYSRLFLDLVDGKTKAEHFYAGRSLEEVAELLDGIDYQRNEIADILKRQNQSFGCTQVTLDNIDKLRDPKAVCLVAGQQAGLFGGPMLVIIKALAVVKACGEYSRLLSRPVVPMFWIAADDHDFAEVNHTYVLGRGNDVCRVSYAAEREWDLPIGETKLDDEAALAEAKQQLHEALGESDFTEDLYGLIDQCYTSDDTMATAFAKMMTALVGRYGLVFCSPADSDIKSLAAPLFLQILQEQDELHRRLETTNEEIVDSGYHLQVEKKPESVHLFLNRDGRRPILRDGNTFTAGEERFTTEELLRLIEEEPHRISTDVFTKPVFQSYLLPVLSQKGGAAEISYLAQMNRLFPLFDRVAPFYKARASASLIERRFEKIMTAHDIDLEDLTGDIEQVINRVLKISFPDTLQKESAALRADIGATMKNYVQTAVKFEPTLEAYSKQVGGKIDHLLQQMEGKMFAAHKRRSQQVRDSIYRLGEALFPNRSLQERSLNISYFLSRYGRGIIPFIFEQLDSEESSHQMIHLSEMKEAT